MFRRVLVQATKMRPAITIGLEHLRMTIASLRHMMRKSWNSHTSNSTHAHIVISTEGRNLLPRKPYCGALSRT